MSQTKRDTKQNDSHNSLSSNEIERGASISTRRIANFHDREDAQQEYRIAAWKALKSADPQRDPKPYQRVSGRNAVHAYCRKESRRLKAISLDQPIGSEHRVESLYSCVENHDPSPADKAAAHDLVRCLRSIIQKLPPRLRQITELSLKGLNTREICKKLGFTRQAINRSKARAQALLRHRFDQQKTTTRPPNKNTNADNTSAA